MKNPVDEPPMVDGTKIISTNVGRLLEQRSDCLMSYVDSIPAVICGVLPSISLIFTLPTYGGLRCSLFQSATE